MLRAALVGCGAMGRNHARVLREVPGVELVAVADADPSAAAALARLCGCRHYQDHRQLLASEKPDTLTVAAPTHAHHRVTLDAIAAGCHVLVEKPIAGNLEDATAMVDAARESGRVLAVGHVERHNPAVLELRRRLDEGELGRIFQIHARRLGPFPQRVRDVGVVVDLATHDLDVMRYLIRSDVRRVFAETRREVHTSNEDLVNGLLRFADGTVGLVESNWLTPTKIRELTVTGERGMFRADYLTQDLFFFENAEMGEEGWSQLSTLRGVSEGAMTRFSIAKVEPLKSELLAFFAAVRGEPAVVVSGEDGLAALRVALALVESGQSGLVVEIST